MVIIFDNISQRRIENYSFIHNKMTGINQFAIELDYEYI
jgi:hypothetical protein